MKKIFLTAAFAVAVASPAFAATTHHSRHNASADATYAQETSGQGFYAVDGATVVAEGKVLGRDPDIFIREGLLREGDRTNDNGGN